MADDGFTVDYTKFDQALSRALVQSKRDPVVFMKEQAKGVVRKIIDITPPGHDDVQGAAARAHGAALVRSDISKIYGTPAAAYQLIKDVAGFEGQAKGFWKHYQKGEHTRAKDLFRGVTGESFGEFDDGKLHESRRNRRGRVGRTRRERPLMFTWSPGALKEYTRAKVDKVGWLAAGWNQAAAVLGFKTHAWIWRHSAPGSALVSVTDAGVRIVMTNAVTFAGAIDGWNSRIQWALDKQAQAMNNRADEFMKKLFEKAGFKVAA